MDDLHLDVPLSGSQEKISMSCGTEGVPNDQKGVVAFFILSDAIEEVVDLNFAKIAVGFDEGYPQELLQISIGSAHD